MDYEPDSHIRAAQPTPVLDMLIAVPLVVFAIVQLVITVVYGGVSLALVWLMRVANWLVGYSKGRR